MGSIDEEQIRRIQIHETIVSHIERERQLFHKGIKVLSLFFIDEVANYKSYEGDDEVKGFLWKTFEEEYNNIVSEKLTFFDDDYQNNKITNNLSKDEIMIYFWNLFRFLIEVIKTINSNKEKYDKKDMLYYIYDIINLLSILHNNIKKILISNKLNSNIIIRKFSNNFSK